MPDITTVADARAALALLNAIAGRVDPEEFATSTYDEIGGACTLLIVWLEKHGPGND